LRLNRESASDLKEMSDRQYTLLEAEGDAFGLFDDLCDVKGNKYAPRNAGLQRNRAYALNRARLVPCIR
jgi:hypothetical protein